MVSQLLFPLDGEPVAPKRLGFAYRPYQERSVRDIVSCLAQHHSCYVVSATGTGKTEIFCRLIDEMNARDGALVVSPRIELVDQTAERLRSRGIPCGIERAHLTSHERVTVACYDSLLKRKRYERFIGMTKLVIVDESHMNYTKASQQMLGYFREAGAKVVGFTATPRIGKADPLSEWYGPCAFTYLYADAVQDAYLCSAKIWLSVLEGLDIDKCGKTSTGDVNLNSPEFIRWCRQERSVQPVRALIEQNHEGKPCVAFVPRIDFAELLRDALSRTGIHASIVHSRMDPQERRQHLLDFEDGTNNVIINVGVLTMGWDFPPVAKLFLCRPTFSNDLYGQMFGRGCRPLPGVIDGLETVAERRAAIAASAKPHFEVYDFCDVTRHSKLVTAADILYPQLTQEVRERVKRKSKPGVEALPLDEIVAAEQAALAREQAARDLLEMSKRKALVADARFSHYERDPFAEPEMAERRSRYTVMLWGKYKRKPFHLVPSHYIKWTLENCNSPKKHPGYFPALRSELTRRNGR